ASRTGPRMNQTDFQAGFSREEGPPLAAGVVRGARTWFPHRTYLTDPVTLVGQYGHVWHPGLNFASCRRNAFNPRVCNGVEPGCECGFYAYWTLDGGTLEWSPREHYIVGVIKGYGRTTIGERGFRCEKARIVALALRRRHGLHMPLLWQRELEAHYEVPVYADPDVMLKEHPPDDPPKTDHPATETGGVESHGSF